MDRVVARWIQVQRYEMGGLGEQAACCISIPLSAIIRHRSLVFIVCSDGSHCSRVLSVGSDSLYGALYSGFVM